MDKHFVDSSCSTGTESCTNPKLVVPPRNFLCPGWKNRRTYSSEVMEFTTAMASGTVRMKEHDFIASLSFGGTHSDQVNNNSTFFGIVFLCTYIALFALEQGATNNWSELKADFLTPNPQSLEHFGEFIGRILKISNYTYLCNWNWKPIFWEHNAQCSLKS